MVKGKYKCPDESHSLPIYFRKVIERLGPTFIKLGQILSLRPDVIPLEYTNELKKLQSEVPAFSFEEVKKITFDTNATKDEEADLFGYKSFGATQPILLFCSIKFKRFSIAFSKTTTSGFKIKTYSP